MQPPAGYASRLLPLLLSLGFALSCAEERAPINRVQPNALEKKFFVGENLSDPTDNPEFYYRPTIVDVDYGASQEGLFTASYAQTLSRVGFEITEDLLLARLTYERVEGTSGKGAPDDNAGQIVAAFKILRHFDVQSDYNPQTGEELNIVEENDTDRPWYQRKFMRVDWSQNLITTAYELDTLATLKAYSGDAISYEAAQYYVEDPTSPDAPQFNRNDGYFDVTNKVFAKPQTLDSPWGTLPLCWLSSDFLSGTAPVGNCNPVELKVRLAFKRVVDRDYEPVDWNGQRMSMFGVFTTDDPPRLGYDRNYGVVDAKWRRFAHRHNIWQNSHDRNTQGQAISCRDDSACRVAAGSHCDGYRAQCTLPYRERQIRTVPFYYGPESDPTLFESARAALSEWDKSVRHAVLTARYAECVHERGGVTNEEARNACNEQYNPSQENALASVPEIFVFCHNPVVAGDPEACGKAGLSARVGDLRYNMANIIQAPQVPSPWGIMVDGTDPISGEVVAASANLWNAVTDLRTQDVINTMRWYLGELQSNDIIDGNYVKPVNVVGSATQGARPDRTSPVSKREIEDRLDAMDDGLAARDPRTATRIEASLPAGITAKNLVDWASEETRLQFGNAALGQGNSPIHARLAAIQGTPVENALINDSFRMLAGVGLDEPLNQTTLTLASPLRTGFWQNRSALERERQLKLAARGTCTLEAESAEGTAIVEFAQKMLAKFPSGEGTELGAEALNERNARWADYIRRRLTFGVLAHELGHSMGLRHVFTSSFDALNFRPQYWQLRTRDKQETAYCATATTDGASCVGPRYSDPVTTAERNGMISTWQQTSVMDYPGDVSQDMIGVGAYDRAAVRFLYGEVADVWDEADVQCTAGTTEPRCNDKGRLLLDQLDTFGGIAGAFYGLGTSEGAVHYSKLDQKLNLIRDCREADTNPPADWDEARDGLYDPVLDGGIVNGTVCAGIPTDYVRFADMPEISSSDGPSRQFDARGRVRRPYMFGSDEYADLGNVAVYRHDSGADAYEIASFFINDYEDRHVFDNHRRGRTTFSLSGAFNRAYSRYHEKLKELSKSYAFLQELYSGTSVIGQLTRGEQGDGLSKPHALAASMVFDHFTRMLTRPAAGEHFVDATTDVLRQPIARSLDQLPRNIPRNVRVELMVPDGTQRFAEGLAIGGRPVHNALDQRQGYYATRYQLFVGSYYEKTLALDLLSDSVDRFISQSRDDFVDGRYRNLNFASLYPEGMRRLIATSLTEDAGALGFRIPATRNRPAVDELMQPTRPLGYTVWWPKDGPATCWPAPGQLGCYASELPSAPAGTGAPAASVTVDPEVGFEVQKFIALFSMMYLPDSWKRDYVDLMRIFQVGADVEPAFPPEESVMFRDPVSGQRYVAHGYGVETINDRTVQRGIGARMLEWANTLAQAAYEVEGVDEVTGELTYARYADNSACAAANVTSCAGQSVRKSTAAGTAAAARLQGYKSLIDYLRQTTARLGFYGPEWRGVTGP